MVTPTFAAGLGVVIAAAMAYPTTRTVISYGGTPPVGGQPCPLKGCPSSGPDARGLATASPGRRLAPPPPAAINPDPSAAPAPGGNGAPAAGPQPIMQYQTVRQWQSGFIGEITITDPGTRPSAHWQLRLTYSSAHIIGVWGGHWTPSGDHAVLVTPDSWDGHSGGWGDTVQVVLAVSGSPGPPSGCAFNGRACTIQPAQQEASPNRSADPGQITADPGQITADPGWRTADSGWRTAEQQNPGSWGTR
jgi:hypothetical protein